MAHRARLISGALAALVLGGCSIPKAPDLWHKDDDGPAPQAPVADDWAFLGAGSYGEADEDDDDDDDRGERVNGPTTVFAGYRGEGEDGEREFDPYELYRAGFRGFSAPS